MFLSLLAALLVIIPKIGEDNRGVRISLFPKEANWVIFVWCKQLLSSRGKTLDFRIKYMG